MATALVRIIGDRQIVGIFAYRDLEELFWLIDQATDPYQCEYFNLKNGGIIWYDKANQLISKNLEKAWAAHDEYSLDEFGDENFDGARLDEYSFMQAIDAKWIKIKEHYKWGKKNVA
jgi:hypothetical protein